MKLPGTTPTTPNTNGRSRRRRGPAGVMGLLMLSMFAFAGPAQAAPSPEVAPPSDTTFVETVTVDESDPAIQKIRAKIAAEGGGGILATYSADFVPLSTAKGGEASTAADLPAECRITGNIYFTERFTTNSSIYNEGTTFCPGATNIVMELDIFKQDTVFFTTSNVGFVQVRGNGPELMGEAEYVCPTGNLSGFMGTGQGTLTLGDTVYGVSQSTGDYVRFNCG